MPDSSFLCAVWRAVALHPELPQGLGEIHRQLSRRYRVEALTVRHYDAGGQFHTLATLPDRPFRDTALPLRSNERDILLRWFMNGVPVSSDATLLPALVPGVIAEGATGPLLVGPLSMHDRPLGVVVWQGGAEGFSSEAQRLFRQLLEPLAAAVLNHLQLHELRNLREKVEADNRALLSRLDRQDISDSVIGAETGLKGVNERIDLVGGADVPVLLLGETGSGKEVVARALHVRSRRADKPFLRVNCGAIPPELVDSHLFGHEKGSFTGAEGLRKGWFERADGGTLFLDEIGDLPLPAQVRLLRILQDGAFERVGGQKQLHVDVRIIAATHRDLRAMVATGQFREDLWYRIAVFPITIPPLRERTEDIPALAAHFALRAAKRIGALPLTPQPRDLALLASYEWPGNVRELAAVMERAVILGNGKSLEIAKSLGLGGPTPPPPPPVAATPHNAALPQLSPLDEAMAEHIRQALTQTGGRVEGRWGAAAMLRINPHTLRARMRKLGIDWKSFRFV